MHVPADIKERIVAKLKDGIATVETTYNVKMPFPKIFYNLRGTTAGTAHYGQWELRFNPVLLMENVDDFIARTVPHELAHLAVEKVFPEAHHPTGYSGFRRAKREVHGASWQTIMRTLGANASRCHSYDVSSVKKNRTTYTYQCGCGKTFEVSGKTHILLTGRPNAKYHCRGKTLKYIPNQAATVVRPAAVTPPPVVRNVDPFAGIVRAMTQALPPIAPKVPNLVPGMTKMEQCKAIYNANKGCSRAAIINLFITQAGMTKAGASTYYHTITK